MFFVNRNEFLDQPAAQFGPFHFNVYGGSAANIEGVIQQIALWMVNALGQRYLGFQAVLFLITFTQTLERPGKPGRGYAVTGMDLGNVVDFFLAIARRTIYLNRPHARQLAPVHQKLDLDLLAAWLPLVRRLYAGLIVSIL